VAHRGQGQADGQDEDEQVEQAEGVALLRGRQGLIRLRHSGDVKTRRVRLNELCN